MSRVRRDGHLCFFFFFQAEDGIRDVAVTGVQTCALPILAPTVPGHQRWIEEELGGWTNDRVIGQPVVFEPDFLRALELVQEGAATTLVTGSFHTVGDALAALPGFAPVG